MDQAQTTPNVSESVLAIFDEAMDERPGFMLRPGSSIDDAVNFGTSAVVERLLTRWTCSDDDCPGRPEWDRALSETWNRITENAAETMREAFRAIVIRELEAFAKAHPEAAWRDAPTAA